MAEIRITPENWSLTNEESFIRPDQTTEHRNNSPIVYSEELVIKLPELVHNVATPEIPLTTEPATIEELEQAAKTYNFSELEAYIANNKG